MDDLLDMLKSLWWIFVLIGLLMWAMVHYAHEDETRWEAFKAGHACRKVSESDNTVDWATGVDSSGRVVQSTIYTAGKIGWLCNDGVTYYRERTDVLR